MSTTTPPPPPPYTGAPGQPPAPGWWLASDGNWYPPEQQTVVAPFAQYQQPPGYVVVQQKTTNGMAIASMVLGILWLYWIGSVLALIFGYAAKKQIAESRGTQGGEGMATAGIVLGWIGVGIVSLLVFIGVVSAAGA
jgi:hypothetical protein